MTSIFEGFVLGTWEVTGFSIPLPVSRIEEEGGNRLVERERPNRDGAKIERALVHPREGGRHFVRLGELAHNQWWGSLLVFVSGDPPSPT